jgi:hypothetical protein
MDKADPYCIGNNGRRTMKTTTAGWNFTVEWKDGSTSWLQLKEVKESNSIEAAQYAKENCLLEEPACQW